ncbi:MULTISPECIES: helix-turn-helix domain-containing protein [Flavobacterium]|uniref:Transcriptional regulator, XRE family n=2 Tax=Flavobacterium TaxID=237 RepID=A5FFG0_FLAJ1|nr:MULTISPECIES: helix-turn-helix transcriptional regulator [Flavobacterium]ABQ06055.1 transcriptional regulator, XRE family [Flavobacterium johnsoniae UW101]OXG00583.1 transcriptional regulator [Flavobacterium johnsoniae UW101]WQG81793.1 helix-turn-helix transcriptional regulator [Flavobacterium johnsoniae UW101]SHG38415.1 DNA-binding transcriptional regulator, XRE-family HTH domain [Flavobacterium defluvii]SHK64466.1 DNA-binding transcriptional regulator, XRE-family HTH domain [Flavobacteriu
MEEDGFKKERIKLGKRIMHLRNQCINKDNGKPISQEELGLRTGYAKNHIGKIERGQTNPKIETLFSIAMELNVDIRELFNFD